MAQPRAFQLGLPFLLSLSLTIGFSGCGPTQRTSSKPDGPVISEQPSSSEPASDDSSGQSSDQRVLATLTAKGAIVKMDDDGNVVSVALIGSGSSAVTNADLAELSNLAELEVLNLMGCDQVTDDGIARLKELSGLKSLFLGAGSRNESLSHVESLTGLEILSVSGCGKVTDEGLAHLAALSDLKVLLLGGTGVTDACIPRLLKLTKLERLGIGDTQLSDEGAAKLKEAMPDCTILGK